MPTSEVQIRPATCVDAERLAAMQIISLLYAVRSGRQPPWDLDLLPGEAADGASPAAVAARRLINILPSLHDPSRRTLVAEDRNYQITGSLGVRFKPEEQEAVFFSLFVHPDYQSEKVALHLLEKALQEIRGYERQTGEKIKFIFTGRYPEAEKRQPILKTLFRLVSRQNPENATVTRYKWNGHNVLRFGFQPDVLEELLAEFGSKLSVFLS